MAIVYTASFDIYGPGTAAAFYNNDADWGWDFSVDDWTILGDVVQSNPAGSFANNTLSYGNYVIENPSWGSRRGDYSFGAKATNLYRNSLGGTAYQMSGAEMPRVSIPGASQHVRVFHIAFSLDSLPALELNHGQILCFQNSFGQVRGWLGVNPSGRLVVYDGAPYNVTISGDLLTTPNVTAVSSAPVIVAETWQSLSIKITTNAVDDNVDIQVYAGDIIASNLVINAAGLSMANTLSPQIDILGLLPPGFARHSGSGDDLDFTHRYVRDLVVCDTSGTYNTDLLGQVFVAAQEMRAEDAGGGWEAQTRSNISDGVLNMQTANTGLRVGDNALLELGSGDFAIEGFWRTHSLPIGTSEMTFASKWQADTNARSWRLYYDADGGNLCFDISTDGTAVTQLFAYPWTPDLDKYYHIAVDRSTAVTRIFVNGTQLGVDITDANTYHNGAANLGLGSDWNSSNTLVTTTPFDGFIDEFRLTVGASRYTTDFTPTAVPFGRDVGDDASFANVELLMGFDGGAIIDESDNTFTLTPGTGVTADEPDDDDNSFQVLNRRPAWDDTYIEARNTFATTILTLTGLPLNTETVVLGAQTYTWVTSLSAGPTVAYEILIGADTAECLDNIIQAINGGAGVGTNYSTGTVANVDVFASALPDPQGLFTATAIGTAGNSVVSTETLTNGSFTDTTFAGGEDIPAPSDFAMERLPVDVTGVLGLQITARGFKSDAGSAQLRFDLVGPAAAVGTGTALGTDLNPAWLRQVFEEDPDTVATITPSTITGGRVRVTRTV